MPFKNFGLSDPLVQGILATGYIAPTEIQSQAIPAAMAGRDVVGCAQTGTGKTAAFVLPILDRLSHEPAPKQRIVRALVLTPTRELAIQIEAAILEYGRFTHLKAIAVYGGVKIKAQITKLRHGVDIVVATPGRLLDHMDRRTVELGKIEVLVLDEADRMLDMGFIHDVRKIVGRLPRNRQTMLFSATISPDVKRLAADMLKNPVTIQIGRLYNPIDTITQHAYRVRRDQKTPLLLHMLEREKMQSVLIFSRTKHGADRIHRNLSKAHIVSIPLHSDRTQAQRQQALDGFKSGKYRVMVATDIAARGIDVDGISHVINYDVPAYPEDYIHRIGRTGRAAATGDAITLVAPEEEPSLRKIEEFIDRSFAWDTYESFTPAPLPKSARPQAPAAGAAKPSTPKKAPSVEVRRRLAGRPHRSIRRR